MNDEEKLLKSYKEDFFLKTGKKMEVRVLEEWESLCKIEGDLSITTLVVLICEALEITMEDVFWATKTDDLVTKRAIIFFILKCNGFSNQKISLISNRDHSIINYSLKSFKIRLGYDTVIIDLLKKTMQCVRNTLNSVTIN